jgi:hypothetical protein
MKKEFRFKPFYEIVWNDLARLKEEDPSLRVQPKGLDVRTAGEPSPAPEEYENLFSKLKKIIYASSCDH